MRTWPDTLAGRILTLLIGMALLLVVGGALLLHGEREERFGERNRFQVLDRVTMLARLLNDADGGERRRIVERASGHGDVVELSDQPAMAAGSRAASLERMIHLRLKRDLHFSDPSSIQVHVASDGGVPGTREEIRERREHGRGPDLDGMEISIRLDDGVWLNFRPGKFEGAPPWAGKTLQLLALLLLLVIVSGLFIARWMVQPLARLADAANRFGLGQDQPPLLETGSREMRNTIGAFNRMQERLRKHITDRSQMLAAVSHDLRTPITSMRLRAEYVEDVETREKILATLDEMEKILTVTLSFARDEAADERVRATDLAALLSSLVDDRAEMGGEAGYEGPDRLVFECRPISLRRALNNLIDNALKYGGKAEVLLSEDGSGVDIVIEDEGPGIPEQELENVFTPFLRLEASRNRDTGGTGLGLTVARTIVHAHGGRLKLANRPQGGLRAVIHLPR